MYLTAHVIELSEPEEARGKTCRLLLLKSQQSHFLCILILPFRSLTTGSGRARDVLLRQFVWFVKVTFTGAGRCQKCEQRKQQCVFTSTQRRVWSLKGDSEEIQVLLILNMCFYKLVTCCNYNITNHFIFCILKEVHYLWFPGSLSSVENCCVLTRLSLFAEPLWRIYCTFVLSPSVSVNK